MCLIGAEINLRRVSEGDGKSPSMSMASSKRKSKQKKNGEKNSLNRNATGREIDVIGPMADIFISHKESGVNRRCAQALLYSRRGDMNTIENGNSH